MASHASTPAAPALPVRPVNRTRQLVRVVAFGLLIGLLVFCWIDVQGTITGLWNGLFKSNGLFRHFVPAGLPPTADQIWPGVKAAVLTLAMAVVSIFFGVIFALALLPLAARNIAPNRVIYEFVRFAMAILRAIPELIMLLLINVALSFSPFSVAVALVIHGIGVQGKLYAEAVEEMDMTPADALRIAGASRIQVFRHAILPGIAPTLLGLTLYRLDANFRSAVTLGAVGGGGIGLLIDNQVNAFQFKDVSAYLIVLVVAVLLIERVSTLLRARLGGDAAGLPQAF